MISAFSNSFKIPELRNRIIFTLGLLFIGRIITTVPAPGIDAAALQRIIADIESRAEGGFLGWVDMFSGGALSNCAVGALSIWPYISASIILQLMTAIIPALEKTVREGESGRQKMAQWTRYLTLAICLVQGLFLAIGLENPEQFGISEQIVMNPGWGFRLMTVMTLTTGTMLMMWLGEQITERGIGNGISLIITINICSRLPAAVYAAYNMFQVVDGYQQFNVFHLVGLLAMIFLVTAGTIALTQGQRKILINTAKRVSGRKVYGGQNTYMPLRVNYGGVMPIIFAGAMLAFPAAILRHAPWEPLKRLGLALDMGSPLYMVTYAVMILFFSFFWVATQFDPMRIADELKRSGGYVPGIRPGSNTADYLDKTMTRITFIGAVALTIIAVIPTVLYSYFRIPWLVASFMGGTSLLIIVGVSLDTMQQMESHLLMHHYDGFLKKGRLRGRARG